MSKRSSRDPGHHQSYWVLKGVAPEFYVCTTAGPRDWRTALCVFDSEAGADGYLRDLSGPRDFVEIMRRHGMQVPDWMRRGPQLPEAHKTTVPELRRVSEGIGVEWVAVNPLPVEPHPDLQRADVLALLRVEDLGVPPHYADLPNTTVQIEEGEMN